jgi:hypothetical protein
LQPDHLPAFINRLKQESVMRGKSFAALSMATSEAEPTHAQEANHSIALKQHTMTGCIEFTLRSSDVPTEQPSAVSVAGSAAK